MIVTIRFHFGSGLKADERVVERYWYHVPRVGERVLLVAEWYPTQSGRVETVTWQDDGSVDVWVR